MIKKKIIAIVLLTSVIGGSLGLNEVIVKATENNRIESYFNLGENIESEDIETLDDRELKINFDEFEKNKETYRNYLNNDIKEEKRIYNGVEIIESNLKWNGDLNLTNEPKSLVLHHIEASRPNSTIPVTDIHQWHLANGWAGIGYHFYITKTGKIYRGRPENAIGAHAKDFNRDSLGIAVEGRYESESMPLAQREAVEKLGKYLRKKYNINTIKGHGELMPTSCPGKNYPLNGIRNNILAYPIYPEPDAPIINDKLAIQYESHVQDEGWQKWVKDGEISGTTGQAKQVEGFRIKLANAENSSIKYRAHVQDEGWKNWFSDGVNAGTVGENKRIEALEIKLDGDIASKYDVEYRAHVQDDGWQQWVKNGDITGTVGEAKRIEAIQVRLVKKSQQIIYQSHVQDDGWQKWNNDGEMAGTVGESKKLEAIRIKLGDSISGVNVKYRVHVQDYGWQNFVYNGELAGTVGEAKRLEAIEIDLEGEKANKYKIEYRVHVEDIGWMPWIPSGQIAGTVGEAKRLEAIEIRIK